MTFSQQSLRHFLVVVVVSILSSSSGNTVVLVAAQESSVTTVPPPLAAQDWATTISAAQQCLKDCGEEFSLEGTTNVFQTCLADWNQAAPVPMEFDFEPCCGMTRGGALAECAGTLTAAEAVLTTRLVSIQASAATYFTCLSENYGQATCLFPGICLISLTGGTGMGEVNDFDVGGENPHATSLANMARTTDESCTIMDAFGRNACDMVQGCCTECAPLIAAVVNAVTDDLLLPAYSATVTTCGGNKTCSDYNVTLPAGRHHRKLAANTAPTTGSRAATYAADCTAALRTTIVQYNETYAAEQFMTCMFQKVGQLAVDTVGQLSTDQLGQLATEALTAYTGSSTSTTTNEDASSSGSSSSSRSTTATTLSFGITTTTIVASGLLLLLLPSF